MEPVNWTFTKGSVMSGGAYAGYNVITGQVGLRYLDLQNKRYHLYLKWYNLNFVTGTVLSPTSGSLSHLNLFVGNGDNPACRPNTADSCVNSNNAYGYFPIPFFPELDASGIPRNSVFYDAPYPLLLGELTSQVDRPQLKVEFDAGDLTVSGSAPGAVSLSSAAFCFQIKEIPTTRSKFSYVETS